MELWIATGNKGKLNEYKLALKELPDLKIFSQADLPTFSARPEDGKTFLENAQIKARTLKSVKTGVWVLGEDSGLEVEGLNGLPGIHSARYAGPKSQDSENIAKLLKMMQIRPMAHRKARFFCSTVVFTPAGEEWHFEGVMNGVIAPKPVGQLGFGYDPVFISEGQTQTLAELGPGFKNQNSHRAKALKAFLAKLQSNGKNEQTV
jgi:XTP/dITP diphosphohydrolase